MTVILKIETHAYAEEKLRDEVLEESLQDDIESCGIVPPEIIIPLRRNRVCELVFQYSEDTTLGETADAIVRRLGTWEDGVRIAFLYDGVRYWIDNQNAKFNVVVQKYLDPHRTGTVSAAVYVSMDAGTVVEEDGIRYYMNSRERGRHHEAHVHICDTTHEHEAVIIIKDGKIIGDFPSKLAKKAKEKVLDNQAFFLEQWNALTDGLKVDVNHFLGTIHY